MIFSCTKKAIDKLKKYNTIENYKEELGFYNWYVDLINLERKNYFLFTNSETLFSFFIYGGTKKELSNIGELFEEKLKEQIIREIGSSSKYLEILFPENRTDRYMKTNSRSVLGSMNDFKRQIEIQIWHKGPLSKTYELINHLMNDCPMGGIDYKNPRRKMKIEIEKRTNQKD